MAVLGVITTILLRRRRRKNTRDKAELDPEPKEITHDPGPAGEGSPHLLPQSPGTLITQSAADIPDLVSLVSPISVPAAGITIISHLISTRHDTLAVVGHRSSASNLSSSQREEETAKQPLIVLTSQELSSSSATSRQPAREPATADTQGHISNTQLTDDQVDFVNSLWSANVPATDIARVMERMRVTGGQGSGIRDMRDDVRPDTAPPSYDGLSYGVGEAE